MGDTFNFSGTLDGETSTATLTLPTGYQSATFQLSTVQTLGGYPLGALGTDLELDVISTNPGSGFGPEIIATVGFATYGHVYKGPPTADGECPVSQNVFSGDAPDSGSASGTLGLGLFNPGDTIEFDFSGLISTLHNDPVGEGTSGAVQITTPAGITTWQNTGFPSETSLYDIAGFVLKSDEGIPVTYSGTIVGYNPSTGGGTETLILNPVDPTEGEIIPFTGQNLGTRATRLNISQDQASFVPVEAFSPGLDYSGTGAIGLYGTHTLQVQDADTLVESNTVTYTLASPPPPPPPPPGPEDCCVPLPSPTLGRYRGAVGINFYGRTLIGDAFSGVIGAANFDTFSEYGNTMRGLVAAPPIHSNRRRIFMPRFELDVESGVGMPECCGYNPVWMLDWSKDGGRTWSEVQVFRSIGRIGEYTQRLRWLRMGQARQWVLRLQCTDPVRRVIIGAYVDTYEGMG